MNFWRKLAYSFGSVGAGLPENAFTAWALYLYVDKLGFPQQLFATAMLIYTIWNCINDPLFGYWSDRTHTRREGMYYGVNALIMRMSVAISAGTISFVQTMTKYKPVADPSLMAPAAVTGFRFLISAVPAVLIGIGLIFVFFYPLHGKRLEDVKTQCALSTVPCADPETRLTHTPAV